MISVWGGGSGLGWGQGGGRGRGVISAKHLDGLFDHHVALQHITSTSLFSTCSFRSAVPLQDRVSASLSVPEQLAERLVPEQSSGLLVAMLSSLMRSCLAPREAILPPRLSLPDLLGSVVWSSRCNKQFEIC